MTVDGWPLTVRIKLQSRGCCVPSGPQDTLDPLRTARTSGTTARSAKAALVIAIVWVLSPIELLPEFLPVIGPLDDVVAVVLLLRYVADEGTVPRWTISRSRLRSPGAHG